jgi:uncharacterized membrane protein
MTGVDVLGFVTLVVTGFVSCAEFGSYAFVHPVIRRLPPTEHIQVEQGLLRTFGRVMPVGMTLCLVLAIVHASIPGGQGGAALWRWLATASFGAALASTIVFNVPINLATGRWDASSPPADWQQARDRWEMFQGLRSWLLLIGFVLLSAGFASGS